MNSFNFVIRDAVAADIEDCLALNHDYETEHIWRMDMLAEGDGWRVNFRKDRLPRRSSMTHESDESRLRLALPQEICYLVAAGKDTPIILGYLTLHPNPIHKIGLIQDIVVSQEFRQQGIGSRLLTVARLWAQEHKLQTLMVEVSTKNYPAIQFLQNRGLRFCGFNDLYFTNQDISVFFGQTLR